MMTYVWWFVFGTLMVLILFGGQIASLVSSMWTRKKETTQSGAGAGASSAGAAPGSGGDRWAHNPPSEMYGGVPQIKWIKPWYEATLFAFAILALLVGGVFILITFLSGWQSVINLLEWGASGMPLSRGAMAVPVLVTIGAVVHKSIRIVPTALAIVAVILGSSIYGWNWWKIPNNCQGMCDPYGWG